MTSDGVHAPVEGSNAGEQQGGQEQQELPNPEVAEVQHNLLLPPETTVAVTDGGGVLKHILAEGQGDPPPQFSRCLGSCRLRN